MLSTAADTSEKGNRIIHDQDEKPQSTHLVELRELKGGSASFDLGKVVQTV